MFVDAAAIVAVLGDEPEAGRCGQALGSSAQAITSAVAVWEAVAALAREDKFGDFELARESVYRLLELTGIRLCAMPDADVLMSLSLDAMRRYGKGPRRLNMGDCLHYACAKFHDVPILSTADEFRSTDLQTIP